MAEQSVLQRRLATLADLERFIKDAIEHLDDADDVGCKSRVGKLEATYLKGFTGLALVRCTLSDGSTVYDLRSTNYD